MREKKGARSFRYIARRSLGIRRKRFFKNSLVIRLKRILGSSRYDFNIQTSKLCVDSADGGVHHYRRSVHFRYNAVWCYGFTYAGYLIAIRHWNGFNRLNFRLHIWLRATPVCGAEGVSCWLRNRWLVPCRSGNSSACLIPVYLGQTFLVGRSMLHELIQPLSRSWRDLGERQTKSIILAVFFFFFILSWSLEAAYR